MYTVYILKSHNYKKSYVGVTSSIQRRLKEHNNGKHSYTKKYVPWTIVYTEIYDNFNKACEREKYFKSASGRRFLKTIFDNLKNK